MSRLITINGPLGAGKTWTVNRLKEYFGPQGIQFVDVNFQEPLKHLTYQLLEVPADFPYDLFKITNYYGFTGREWMIQVSERSKDLYRYIWVDKATSLIRKIEKTPLDTNRYNGRIFIADSQGFDVELDFLQDSWVAETGHELVTSCIEPLDKSHLRGMKWQHDDSRFNLAHRCDIVVTESSDLYYALRGAVQRRGWA